jgi:hypothetical protein
MWLPQGSLRPGVRGKSPVIGARGLRQIVFNYKPAAKLGNATPVMRHRLFKRPKPNYQNGRNSIADRS